jgi:pimeloyl-ACP methyl ester carboxylesterase
VRVVESGPADGAPILLVHGWGSSVYSFSDTIPALASGGHHVFALDLPGFGLSDKPAESDFYTTQGVARAVLEAATALGVDRFTFLGHSMGGAVGLRLVLGGERRIEKLVLVNSVGLGRAPLMAPVRLFSPRIVEPLLKRFVRRATVRLILRIAYGTSTRPTNEDVEQYWAPSQFPEMLRACRLLAHNFDFRALSDAELQAIDVPVLAIGSGRDRMVLGCAERARLIPDVHVLTLEEGGHLSLQECAGRVNPSILAFLKRRAA